MSKTYFICGIFNTLDKKELFRANNIIYVIIIFLIYICIYFFLLIITFVFCTVSCIVVGNRQTFSDGKLVESIQEEILDPLFKLVKNEGDKDTIKLLLTYNQHRDTVIRRIERSNQNLTKQLHTNIHRCAEEGCRLLLRLTFGIL